jgi:hypothetical protein
MQNKKQTIKKVFNLVIVVTLMLICFFVGLNFGSQSVRYSAEFDMLNCVRHGGEYNLRNWSIYEDEYDYRVTCKIPEKTISEYKIDITDAIK